MIVIYIIPHQDVIILEGGANYLVFYRNAPDEEEVLAFINKVIKTAKNYYKVHYTKYDKYTAEEELNGRLYWLKNNEIITEDEFSDIMESYKMDRLVN